MTKILTIEDEVEIREALAEELEDEGYEVFHAGDGMEGLQMIFKHKPDLVLCDINMPRKNGYQLLKEIRDDHPVFAEMPFIFLTALTDRERVLAGLKDGADGYLTKPIDFELLVATVNASLRQMNRIKQNSSAPASQSETDSAMAAGVTLENPINTIAEIVQAAVASTDAFSASLEQAGAHLADGSNPEQATAILAALAQAIKNKGQGAIDLKKRLVQTSREVQTHARGQDSNVRAASGKLDGQIETIMKIVQSAAESSNAFGASIEQAGSHLRNGTDPEQAKTLMAAIVRAIKEQEQGGLGLKSHLAQSSREIEELKEELAIVRREALTDGLTGVANRKCFDQMLDQTIAQVRNLNQPMCLYMMDIDHFKQFNDTFGHQAGDAALKLVAATLKMLIRDCDLVARYGGEEFVVILPKTKLDVATNIAERIRKSLMEKELVQKTTGDSRGNITLSTGIASLQPDDTAKTLLKRADACLYAAKNAGRNCVIGETNLPDDGAGNEECAA